MKQPDLIINATNLGQYIDGIGTYILNILRELSRLSTGLHTIIYVNKTAACHIGSMSFPAGCEIRYTGRWMSPDHGFRGHILRLLYANLLGVRHCSSTFFVASQLEAMFFRRNLVITIHDIIPLLFPADHKKQYFYFRYLLGVVLKRARAVIAPSLHTKELLMTHYGLDPHKIAVIHNGVSTPAAAARSEDDKRFILFNGRLVPTKNVGGLLRAFGLIRDRIPHRVIITGHFRPRGMKALLHSLKGERVLDDGRVEFRGHVSAGEMEHLLHTASLLAFPSLYEGFGLPPLEGMIHGCPVVVSRVSSLPEVCGNAAEYVDPSNTRSIADGMYRVLTDSRHRMSLIRKGLVHARRFRWEESALRHVDVFQATVTAHLQRSHSRHLGSQGNGHAGQTHHFLAPVQWLRIIAERFITILAAAVFLGTTPAGQVSPDGESPSYADVAAILDDNCVMCHSGPKAPRQLRLDSYNAVRAGSANGQVVVPHRPEESELIRRVRGTSTPRMPLSGPPWLDEQEILLLESWIREGATAGKPGTQAIRERSSSGDDTTITYADVGPVFRRSCMKCHNHTGLMGAPPEGLVLTSFESVITGTERVYIVPGNPDASELVRRIRGEARPRMPHDGPPYLSDDDIALVEQWVRQGARNEEGRASTIPTGRRVRLHGTLTSTARLDDLMLESGGRRNTVVRATPGDYVEVRGTVTSKGGILVERIRSR